MHRVMWGKHLFLKIFSSIQNECDKYHSGSTDIQVKDFHSNYYRSQLRFGKSYGSSLVLFLKIVISRRLFIA